MQQLQYVYKVNPDDDDRNFTDSELTSVAQQIMQKPMLYMSPQLAKKLKLNIDLAIPVGGVMQVGVGKDPFTNLTGIALMYQLSDETMRIVMEEDLLTELKIKPFIIGLFENDLVSCATLTNMQLTI